MNRNGRASPLGGSGVNGIAPEKIILIICAVLRIILVRGVLRNHASIQQPLLVFSDLDGTLLDSLVMTGNRQPLGSAVYAKQMFRHSL